MTRVYDHVARGGRQGGLKFPPPIPLTPASRPLPQGFPPLCSISIVKYYAILRNFSPFLPVPATLGIPLPVLSPPASRTPPAPYSPGLPPPCPPPLACPELQLKAKTSVTKQKQRIPIEDLISYTNNKTTKRSKAGSTAYHVSNISKDTVFPTSFSNNERRQERQERIKLFRERGTLQFKIKHSVQYDTMTT